jgi:hypothetical protein
LANSVSRDHFGATDLCFEHRPSLHDVERGGQRSGHASGDHSTDGSLMSQGLSLAGQIVLRQFRLQSLIERELYGGEGDLVWGGSLR